MELHIGIDAKNRKAIAGTLATVQADTYSLYLKTHNFHWNVSGPLFPTLHALFEQQYQEMWLAVDAIAERIRALGFPAPGTPRQIAQLTSIKEEEGVPKAEEMIRQLLEGHETVVRTARNAFKLADEAHDQPTTDLLNKRLLAHEKMAWMLRAQLE